ncbi:ABC transporter ATP-binding protein [Gordonia sp. HY002]|uniref:ABC transporter ATP-binding protein n=2 Tax=Gordonia zhenghanii TaxID=2911516 RepID=UPI001EF1381F|nr:ABC transporter ATP-binding protein [Gordonia zhenghanii]MCF8569318.1 ABC transporter ATP-binding protein [Gordonia zhenghanii]MCF8608532.1 ABC transporter ATP-binding protein [Gordonia zhenghanii]
MLSVSDATRRIGAQTLFASLSFTVERGQCAAVVGPNGVGKSSLLRAVVDDELLDDGSVLIEGRAPDDRSPEFRRRVAAELGEQAVFYDATVGEHLAMLAGSHGIDPDIEAALSGAGIGELRDRFPHTLSTGQRQRFALVAVFIRPARLVVLDEPERGLDVAGQEWVADELDRLTDEGAAVLIATHSRELVERCADVVVDLAS